MSPAMRPRPHVPFLALATLVALAALAPAGPAAAAPDRKLKPGAEGKLCLDCHGELQKALRQPVVHTPVRSRNCIGCHDPHASNRPKFLTDAPNQVCGLCHGDLTPAGSASTHKPVAEQKCLGCHDAHASANKGVLVKPALDLCAGCHPKLVERAAKAKHRHAPIQSAGCAAHPAPHTKEADEPVLKEAVSELCTGCHRPDKPLFAKAHYEYKVAGARCTSCHDPHGSDRKGLLFDKVHPPVARGMCGQCHQPAGSATPFALRTSGVDLCRGCHAPMVNGVLGKNRVHQPVLAGQTCLGCHAPHASSEEKLLLAPMKALCARCHEDTIQRDVRAASHHEPVKDGQCTACHDPHGQDAALLLQKADSIALCQTCHDWGQHSSHPLGPKVADPRNPNLSLECLSCHRAHGTEHKKLMPFSKGSELCTACHQQYRR